MLASFVVFLLFSSVSAEEKSPFSPCNYTLSLEDDFYAFCMADTIIFSYVNSRSVAENGEIVYELDTGSQSYRKKANEDIPLTELRTPGEGRDLVLDLTPGQRYAIYGNAKENVLYATFCQQPTEIRRRDSKNSNEQGNTLFTADFIASSRYIQEDMWTHEHYAKEECKEFEQ